MEQNFRPTNLVDFQGILQDDCVSYPGALSKKQLKPIFTRSLMVACVLTTITLMGGRISAEADNIAANTEKTGTAPTAENARDRNEIYNPVLTQANKWVWDLSHYKSVGEAFSTRDGVELLLSTDECCKFEQSILWNPLTGRTIYLPRGQRELYERANQKNIISGNDNFVAMHLPGGIALKAIRPFDANGIFGLYHEVLQNSTAKSASFYIVKKLLRREQTAVYFHDDVGNWSESFDKNLENVDDIRFAPLPDGTVLVWSFDERFLIRIDPLNPGYANVSNAIFLFDATKVNLQLKLDPCKNPRTRQVAMELFFAQLESDKVFK